MATCLKIATDCELSQDECKSSLLIREGRCKVNWCILDEFVSVVLVGLDCRYLLDCVKKTCKVVMQLKNPQTSVSKY